MKPSSIVSNQLFKTGAIVLFCLIGFPLLGEAKGPHQQKHGKGNSASHPSSRNGDGNDHDRQYYTSRPRSTFVLSLGTGYAGRGYYYGPPNSPYYYQRPEVSYYATREAAPREYYGNGGYHRNSTDASVQSALARRGYYSGSIDGDIGPQSRRSIARYQRDNGLRSTGYINDSLLRSLGL